jgi:hypothetical protein
MSWAMRCEDGDNVGSLRKTEGYTGEPEMAMAVEGLTGETPPERTGAVPDQQEDPNLDEGPDAPVLKPDRFTGRSHELICTA